MLKLLNFPNPFQLLIKNCVLHNLYVQAKKLFTDYVFGIFIISPEISPAKFFLQLANRKKIILKINNSNANLYSTSIHTKDKVKTFNRKFLLP